MTIDERHRFRRACVTRRSLTASLAVLSFLASVRGSNAAGTSESEAFIRHIGDQVLATLQNEQLSGDDKLATIKDLLDRYTDLDLLAKLVLGKYWRTASASQRDEYRAIFRQLVMKTLADRLHEYGGETVEIVGSREINDRDSLVSTDILRPSGAPPIRVDWRVRNSGDKQAIIDVVAEGRQPGGDAALGTRRHRRQGWHGRADSDHARPARAPVLSELEQGADRTLALGSMIAPSAAPRRPLPTCPPAG